MSRLFLILPLLALPLTAAADLKYYPDPVHKSLGEGDAPPMGDVLDIARQGDARAQFMIADMYEKGKGGFARDLKESRQWFELSGMHGYGQSFIRLAAEAKRAGNNIEAWQWYTLAIDTLDRGPTLDYVRDARKTLVEKAPLTSDDISAARKSMHAWEDARDEKLKAEKEQPNLKEKDNEQN